MTLTLTDFFAGAGGSSTGAAAVPGLTVTMAANHWNLAIEVHNENHPQADHAASDLHEERPSFFPRTDLCWASPECTKWSPASGRKSGPLPFDEGLFEDPDSDDAATRSRLLMFDVLRYAEYHRYDMLVVENVVDIAVQAKYALAWAEWRRQLRNLGYKHRVVSLNSMHAQAYGMPAPQSRDRIYIVCWRDGVPEPDLERVLRPQAWCPRCEAMVESRQSWKPGRTVGRYRAQYRYVHGECGTVVEPGWLPAAAVIDWTNPGTLVGDRLAPKTRARIAAGIARYWRPFTLEVGGNTFERHPGVRTWPVEDTFTTFTTTATRALAIPMEGREGKHAAPVDVPFRTQTTRNETGLLLPFVLDNQHGNRGVPVDEPLPTTTTATTKGIVSPQMLPFLAELRGGGSDARSVAEPAATFTASGTHHGLVTRPGALLMRNNTPRGDAGQMTTPVSEVMRTLTAAGHQSLIQHESVRSRRESPTVEDLAAAERLVSECLFRMLTHAEIAAGMAFPDDYRWQPSRVTKRISSRDLVRMAGNAVTPPASRDLLHVVVDTLTAA